MASPETKPNDAPPPPGPMVEAAIEMGGVIVQTLNNLNTNIHQVPIEETGSQSPVHPEKNDIPNQ